MSHMSHTSNWALVSVVDEDEKTIQVRKIWTIFYLPSSMPLLFLAQRPFIEGIATTGGKA